MHTKTITTTSLENQIGLPTGNYLVLSLQYHQLSWLLEWLNKEGCLVWKVAGSVYLKDMPRARRKLAEALELMTQPDELELVPCWKLEI